MDRNLVNAQAQLQRTYLVDGVPTDPTPNSATVTIVRADGTAIVTAQSATPGTPPPLGTFVYNLTPGQNNRLDRLTATFTSSLGNAVVTSEIVGGFLIGADQLRALYPNDTIVELESRRANIEQRLELACGRAFVPRYERERATIDRRGRLKLKWGSLRTILTVATDLTTLTTAQIANLYVDYTTGHIWGVPPGIRSRDVTISYEHGLDYPDETARSAALTAIQEVYGPNRVDNRVRTKSVDNVSVTYASGAAGSESHQEFASSDVVNFIKNNQRPLVG